MACKRFSQLHTSPALINFRFLLARLHVDSFLDKLRKPKVISTLEKLSKGLEALDKAYNEAITRIDEQPAEHRLLAWRALSWITYAQRPLTTRELCLAVSIEPSNKALIDEDAYVVEDIVSACAGLVAVDQESTIIRLVHATTQEYFEQVLSKWNPGAQEEIATACLTYLSFDTFQSGRCESDETFEKRIAENGFFDYSTRHWSEHVRPVQNTISSLALSFLCDDILVDCAIQGALTGSYKYNGYSQRYPGTKGLHLTARCGLLHLTQELLMGKYTGCKVEADSKDGYGQTPLSYAAENGHEGIVKLLLDTGKVDADWKDGDGRTPLWWAAGNGHEAIVKLLLDTGKVDADWKDGDGRTPLWWAAGNGHEAIVKLLLDTGKVDADSKDGDGRTPLSYAVQNGHEAIVKLLQSSPAA
jgi:ankyrin repeat protein